MNGKDKPMKAMTKILMMSLAELLLMTLVSCNGGDQPVETTTPEVKDMPIELIKDGSTEYTIVYEDNASAAELAKSVAKSFSKWNVSIETVKASEAQPDYGKEIIIGNARQSVSAVTAKMKTSDFAACVCEDDWVLTATDDVNYKYLTEVLDKKVFGNMTGAALTVDPAADLVYSTSAYADITYASYMDKQVRAISDDFIKEIFTMETYKTTSLRNGLPYRLYVPSNYDPSKSYPVVLILHGAGERGTDNTAQLVHVVKYLFDQENSPVHDAIVVMPQCPGGNQWVDTPWADGNYSLTNVKQSNESKAVVELLDQIAQTYSTDTDRYYAMGISMGGFGTWDLIMRYPEKFAAAVPICGGADVAMAETLKDHPIYTAHGSADTVVPPTGTQEMVKALQDAGSTKLIYKEVAGAGHDVWTDVSKDPAVMEWMFSHKLSDRK